MTSVSLRGVLCACVAALLVLGTVSCASLADRNRDRGLASCPEGSAPPAPRAPGGRDHHGDSHGQGESHGDHDGLSVGPSCNLVEATAPQDSTYRPDVAAASSADRERARSVLRGVNAFCRTTSPSEVRAEWTPGNGSPPTHFFNPDRRGSAGLDPSTPRAVLIYDGQIGGVMFTGSPLPFLGSIPRAHSHDLTYPREMLHVYCADSLAEAFTPSRRLGVLADSIRLSTEIRQRIPSLVERRLGAVLGKVRGYVGDDLPEVDPRTIPTPGGADPAVRAQRRQIWESLMLLSEPQLRRVRAMVRDVSPV